jgi:hypothetical protein
MDLKGITYGVQLVHLAHDMDQCLAFVNNLMNLQV